VRIPVILLAAGASRRMGRPKPLLDFDGRTCLELVAQACLGSRASLTVLVVGAHEARVRAAAPPHERLRIVRNEAFERGQTSSLKAGLEAVPDDSDGFIVLPVDLPLVTNREIDLLIEALERSTGGRSIFIATYEGRRGHPILMTRSHLPAVRDLGDDEPLSGLVRRNSSRIELIPVDNSGVVARMNTPAQYEQVLAEYRKTRSA